MMVVHGVKLQTPPPPSAVLYMYSFCVYINSFGDISDCRPLLSTLVDISSCNDIIKTAPPRCQYVKQ